MTSTEGGRKGDDLGRIRKSYAGYLRYVHLGLVMAGIILAFTFAGQWLDQRIPWKTPVLTIGLSLLGVAGAMLYLFKETGKR